MNERQTRNKEIVTQITELMGLLDTEHPDAVMLIANLGNDDDEGVTEGVVCVVGCQHGMEAGIYAAIAQEESMNEAVKRARKKFKQIGSRATKTVSRNDHSSGEGLPENPVPKGHPLYKLFESMRNAAVEIKDRQDKKAKEALKTKETVEQAQEEQKSPESN